MPARKAGLPRARGVLLVASSGGHLLQLVQLRDEWSRPARTWVTFDTSDAHSLLSGEDVVYAHYPTNRSLKNLVRNAFLAFRVLRQVRPIAVITTGSGVAVPFCYLGRLMRLRVIFIESFSRITQPSLTARLVYPIASEFFIQWPGLSRRFPRARYEGNVFGLRNAGY